MSLRVYDITKCLNKEGISISIQVARGSPAQSGMDSLINCLKDFYKEVTLSETTVIHKRPQNTGEATLYYVKLDPDDDESEKSCKPLVYLGALKITPQVSFPKKPKVNHSEDYAVSDLTIYVERYFVNFLMKANYLREIHRDDFIKFVGNGANK